MAVERGGLGFSWDASKDRSNKKKHGVSFEEALTVFADPLAVIIDDPDHSSIGDERAIIMGLSLKRHILAVAFAEADQDTIRIISARRATRREMKHYEGT